MSRAPWLVLLVLCLAGCQAPLARLKFTGAPPRASQQPQRCDIDRDGKAELILTFDEAGRVDALHFDDDEDGTVDHAVLPGSYSNEDVPHVVILLDSIPFQRVAARYAAGDFRWFDPPTKVIGPFPSLTEVCYTELLHAPPMPGMIDQYYDSRARRIHNGMWSRIAGHQYPWERSLHYRAGYSDEGFAYLDPRPWFQAELERARRAIDASDDRVTIVYLTAASGMACKYGLSGIDEVLDGAARLCLQLLHERRGAIKISVMADHGHNLVRSRNIDIAGLLRGGGFRVAGRLDGPDEVVLELNGLVTYAGVNTKQPKRVADRLVSDERIEFAMYRDGDRVIVRDAKGDAAIEARGERIRYSSVTRDVLGYDQIIPQLAADADGFVSRDDWFAATVDHEYPDAPPRLWDALDDLVLDPPDVMFTTRDGWCVGQVGLERYITMESTHGSLNQINTATFLMTMTGRVSKPLRIREVMPAIEPSWRPGAVRR